MLIHIEESHCLLTMMKRGILKKKSTCLDHEKEKNGPRIPARKREWNARLASRTCFFPHSAMPLEI
jgi:hypothetical protein